MTAAIGIGLLNGVLSASGTKERIPEDAEAVLRSLSASVNPIALRTALTEATDADLEFARTELREFASVVANALYLSEKTPDLLATLHQRGVAAIDPLSLVGLQVFGMLVQQFVPEWREFRAIDAMRLFLAGLSLSRTPAIRRGLQEIAKNSDQLHATLIEVERFFGEMSRNESEPKP